MQRSQAVSVAFQRAFTDGAASTVCLPFPMTSITGGNVYGFRGITWDATLNNEGGWVATMIDQSPEAGNLLSATEANKPYLFMPSGDSETVDAIGEISLSTGEVTFDSNAWYDLSGRKLAEKPTQRGIYINGNKKVVLH